MNNRIEHIDIAKGISIMLVAMFHSPLKAFIPEIIEPMSLFRMPLFFFLSGVFFSYSASPSNFLIKKSEGLLKPYFAVLLFLFLINAFFQSEHFLYEIKGVFYGNGQTIRWASLWFLTHLFSVYCFSYIIFRFTIFNSLPAYIQGFLMLASLFVGALYVDAFWSREIIIFGHALQLPGLPFSIDIIFITSVFFISGYLLKEKVIDFSPNVFYLIIYIFIFLCIIFFSDAHTDLNKRIYARPMAATLGAITGIYMVMCVSWLFLRFSAPKVIFQHLGRASLYILIFHPFIGNEIYNNLSTGITNNATLMVLATISFILSILAPLGIEWMVHRNNYLALFFLPFKSNNLLKRILYARR